MCWRRLDHIISSERAETIDITHGIELALEHDWQNIIIESDCLAVVNTINSYFGNQFVEAIMNIVSLFV